MTIWIAAAALVAAQPAAVSAPQQINLADASQVIRVLQEEGYKAKLDKDKAGDPMIESAAQGATFYVYFYGCKNNRNCTDLALASSYEADPKKPVSLATINDFNMNKRFGRAYLDSDKDSRVEMDIIFTDGKMDRAMLADHFQVWTSVLADFHKAIGW